MPAAALRDPAGVARSSIGKPAAGSWDPAAAKDPANTFRDPAGTPRDPGRKGIPLGRGSRCGDPAGEGTPLWKDSQKLGVSLKNFGVSQKFSGKTQHFNEGTVLRLVTGGTINIWSAVR